MDSWLSSANPQLKRKTGPTLAKDQVCMCVCVCACACVCVCVCLGVGEASVSVDKTGNGMSWHPPCWLGRGWVCESLYTYTHTQVGAARAGVCVCTCTRVRILDATLLVIGVLWDSTETIWLDK